MFDTLSLKEALDSMIMEVFNSLTQLYMKDLQMPR